MKGKNGVHRAGLAESVRVFFGAQGALAGAKGYESRPGQARMAEKVAAYRDWETDRKSTRLNSSHSRASRMPSSA